MTTRGWKIIDIFLFGAMSVATVCFLITVVYRFTPTKYQLPDPKVPLAEQFEPSLLRLDNMETLSAYIDSFYKANYPNRTYPGIVSETLRKRFYHGYSLYDNMSNPSASIFQRFFGNAATAIVIPNDILKHANAACSQQSIVGMELFLDKGYQVRKIEMFDTVTNSGHFAYEVYFDKGWHFFDVDEEPDAEILRNYKRPSTAFLARHLNIVAAAYSRKPEPAKFERLISSYKEGPVNKFPAPNAYLLQMGTKLFNYFGWILIGALIFIRVRMKKRSKASQRFAVFRTTDGTVRPIISALESKTV